MKSSRDDKQMLMVFSVSTALTAMLTYFTQQNKNFDREGWVKMHFKSVEKRQIILKPNVSEILGIGF